MVLAIVQARMGSTRLSGKVMKKVMGKPLIGYLIERLKTCKKIDKIIVATSTSEKDGIITNYTRKKGLEVYRGKENDVLDRYYQAALLYKADTIVRITADCPLILPDLVDKAVDKFFKRACDYLGFALPYPEGLADISVFSFKALKTAWQEASKPSEREHVVTFIINRPVRFKIVRIEVKSKVNHLRFTVDEREDFLVVKKILESLYRENKKIFTLKDIEGFAYKNPKIFKKNINIPRNEGYRKSLLEDKKWEKEQVDRTQTLKKLKVVFRVDGNEKIGLGHIMRSVEIAKELRRKYRAQVIFACNPNPFIEKKLRSENYSFLSNRKRLPEEDFIKSAVLSCRPHIIFIDHNYRYPPAFVGNLKQSLRVCFLENFGEGIFNADCVIFPSAHLSDAIINDKKWKTGGAKLFHGPEYVVINERIRKIRGKKKNSKNEKTKYVVITGGGSDPNKVTIKLLSWLCRNFGKDKDIKISILLGRLFRNKREIMAAKDRLPDNIKIKKFTYSAFFSSNLAVSTFGVTVYELIFLGVPLLAIGHNRQTAGSAKVFARRYGLIDDLGCIDFLKERKFTNAVRKWIKDDSGRKKISTRERAFLDGKGAVRIAEKIISCLE